MIQVLDIRRNSRLLRTVLAISTFAIGSMATRPAAAADFMESCKAFSAAMSDGKAQADDDGVCTCIRSKLSEDDEGKATNVMQLMIEAQKSGKKSGKEPTPEQKAVMEKLAQAGDSCESGK